MGIFNQLCRRYKIKEKDQNALKNKLDTLSRIRAKSQKDTILLAEKEVYSYLRTLRIKEEHLELWQRLYFLRDGKPRETLEIIKNKLNNKKIFYTL